jgi:hypothetical protein
MAIKEEFASFKSQVETRLASIETKLTNPLTPPEVTAGMQAILTQLETIDTGITPPAGGGEPL